MKQLKIPYEDKTYTLEFTRQSAVKMEAKGFNIQELDSKPMTMIPLFFEGAFYSQHKMVKPEIVNDIYNRLENREEVIGLLSEMYQDVLLSTIGDVDGEQGNMKWEKNW